MTTLPLVLGSSSPYRKNLLERLRLPFVTASPDIDEQPLAGETAEALVLRLASDKAQSLCHRFPEHLIIASDQAAALPDGQVLGKPGNHERACEQLARCSGHPVCFYTGLTLLNSQTGQQDTIAETFTVHFRNLASTDIEHYLRTETPYDCAGSFRMEGLGIALFSRFEGRDPNSLIGLPLMALIDLLKKQGVDVLAQAYRNS